MVRDTREQWFTEVTRRLTGETSPRYDEVVRVRHLIENAEEVRAAMRYESNPRLSAAEQGALLSWMDYVTLLRNDVMMRVVNEAPGRNRRTFALPSGQQRLMPAFATGALSSQTSYQLTVTGDPRYSASLTVTTLGLELVATWLDTDGTTVNTSTSSGGNLSITFPATVDPATATGDEVVLHTFAVLTITATVPTGSALAGRVTGGDEFMISLPHEISQPRPPEPDGTLLPDRAGTGVLVPVLFN